MTHGDDDNNGIKQLQLEIGGSFFELIEFSLTRRVRGKVMKGVYGVNVAKVREVVRMPKINPLSSRVKGVAGLFELRGVPIPAVHLSVALGDDETESTEAQQVIVTEFSSKRAGFIVDATHRIRRVAWEKVLPPTADVGACINGMTLIDNNEFLFILDLERILLMLEYGGNLPEIAAETAPAPVPHQVLPNGSRVVTPQGPRILLVDDSKFIRNGARQALAGAGYRVVEAADGADAYQLLEKSASGMGEKIDVVITDVEMPRMNGLQLTKKIRENPEWADMPVILHTSLSGKANQAAGISVGANGYVIKNDFKTLLTLVQEILGTGAYCEIPAA